jgi:hypothetical protein
MTVSSGMFSAIDKVTVVDTVQQMMGSAATYRSHPNCLDIYTDRVFEPHQGMHLAGQLCEQFANSNR